MGHVSIFSCAKNFTNQNKTELQTEEKTKIKTQDKADDKREKMTKNEIKFSNLKKKMKEKIDQIQAKETELNVQYMDVSTKLTLLQNHQLLIQLEYQSQQLDEITAKKEELEKIVFE